jgi:hypothetical protein
MLPNSLTQKNEALRLWLTGTSDDVIAEKLSIERATIETWRLDERWHELRSFVDLLVTLRNETKSEEADERAIMLVDAGEMIAGKIMKRGLDSITASDLYRLMVSLKMAREIRDDVRRSRFIRDYARKDRQRQW